VTHQRVPNTALIRVIFSLDGQTLENTYHAEMPAGYAQADLDNLAAVVDFTPAANMRSSIADAAQYVRTDVVGLNQENDMSATANLGAGAGAIGGGSFPGLVSFAVARLSGLTGRSARGRVFVPAIPRAAVASAAGNANQITTAYANAYVGLVEGFRTTIEAIGLWNAVLVSRYHEGSKRAEAVTFTWTSTKYTTLTLAAQRRRMS